MKKKKTFTYQIELSSPMYPRMIADILTGQGNFAHRLLSVTDQQRNDHWQGLKQSATYQVRDESEPEHTPITYAAMLAHYQACYEQATSTPERDAYAWMLTLLKQEWVDDNMGLLHTYVREFLVTIDTFQAHCEHTGMFAKEE